VATYYLANIPPAVAAAAADVRVLTTVLISPISPDATYRRRTSPSASTFASTSAA
jgi:hypothetical protein